MERFKSRKFILSAGTAIVSSILVFLGKIPPDVYQVIILGTVGTYIAGNVFQKKTSAIA